MLPQPITLAADATTLCSVYRSLRTINRFETFTLFSRVTLIRRLQSTSDLDHFHASEVACSRVKSRDDPISGRRGDSGVLYSFIYKDLYAFQQCKNFENRLRFDSYRQLKGGNFLRHSVGSIFTLESIQSHSLACTLRTRNLPKFL